jgi:phosphatidylserine/phosphatidylglycerophosphate/cardiolipin synthase-like enzyme
MRNDILRPGRNCQGIYPAGRSGLLVDGRNYFRAFYEVAQHAKRYICIAGWQFERSAALLRGADAKAAGGEVIVAPFLNDLCRRNPELRIYILMWDFSPVVAFDKEWFNKLVLDLTASERIEFRFDGNHALYASHHQKLAIVDGVTAFVGGLDIAANSWDDRIHWAQNAERVLTGEEYEPYHDVQSCCTGPAAWELTRFFEQRWVRAGGAVLGLPQPSGEHSPLPIRKMMPLAANYVAISETRAQTLIPILGPVRHIRQLYLDAIDGAERLIYVENQYFSSQAVYQALKDRLTDHDRPCPQIVLVLPKRMHTLIEDISLSVVQAKMLRSLTEIAVKHERDLGIYYTAATLTAMGPEKSTYIHSKVLIVDDRLLSVGSANITNRSMGMDTELNLTWEAGPHEPDLVRSIRRVRANLLAEHTGLRRLSERRALGSMDGLVKYLNSHADQLGCRLRRHTMSSFLEEASWIKDLMPDDLSIDPERPLIEESIYEAISRDRNSIFAKGLVLLNELALQQPDEPLAGSEGLTATAAVRMPEPRSGRKLNDRGVYRWYVIAVIVLGVAGIVWLLLDP